MHTPDLTNAVWRKSTRSNGGGGECVELTFVWRKSSHSNGGGGECVEVAVAHELTALRDSKNPAGGVLVVPATGWHLFRSAITSGR